jgi:polar amino acid transport system substrate-binding protein
MLSKPVSPSDLFDSILAAYGHEPITQQRYSGSKFDMGILRPVQGAEILLVEDNEINQQVASEILEQAGFFVDIANHGQEALDMLANKEYDCVLMDVQMPVMDGFTATGKIRGNPHYVDLPVLAMTANATHEDRERSLDAGMNEHIAKPIRPQILFEALLKWIPHGERILPEMANPDISDQAGSSLSAGDSGGALPVPIPQIEGIDTHSSIERLGGSVESYIRLIEKFLDNQVDAIENFSQQIQHNDFETAERTAHTLKGVSALIGADKLRTISESLESSVRSEKVPDLGKEIEEARVELMMVFERFREYLHQQDDDIAEGDNDEISLPEFKNKLVQLQEKLQAYDAEADDDLREIIKLAGTSSTAPQLKKLAKLLDQYDFEGGLVVIGEILENLSTQGD